MHSFKDLREVRYGYFLYSVYDLIDMMIWEIYGMILSDSRWPSTNKPVQFGHPTLQGQGDDMQIYHEYKGIGSISPLVYYIVYIE